MVSCDFPYDTFIGILALTELVYFSPVAMPSQVLESHDFPLPRNRLYLLSDLNCIGVNYFRRQKKDLLFFILGCLWPRIHIISYPEASFVCLPSLWEEGRAKFLCLSLSLSCLYRSGRKSYYQVLEPLD